jgi:PKD repeat protein
MHTSWLVVAVALVLLVVAGCGPTSSDATSQLSRSATGATASPVPVNDGTFLSAGARQSTELASSGPSTVTIVPPAGGAPEICANGTPANPFPVSYLPYGYLTPNLFGLGANDSAGFDDICYTGGAGGAVSNDVNFSSVGGAEGVVGFPHVEYGQDLWGGSPGNMSPGFQLPETVSNATNSSLWLTNSYSVNDTLGAAAYDYVWDNFLSSYVPNPGNISGPTNYSLEVMLWMSTGLEGSPFTYFPDEGSTSLPTLINTTLSDQPWDFSSFCQGTDNSELTLLYFYNGTGGAMNASSRTFGVNFSAVLLNINQMIRNAGISCWAYPHNNDVNLYLDDLNLGSEFLTPFPSPYYGQAIFNWNLASMCFTFPHGTPTVSSVSCASTPGQPLAASPTATPSRGTSPLTVEFSAAPTGGIPPYTYNWSFGDASWSTNGSPSHLYATPGTFLANLTVDDSNGSSVVRHLTIDVSPPVLHVNMAASASSGFAPLTVQFKSVVSGGLAPYSYHWLEGSDSIGSSANSTFTFQAAGTFLVYLWVNDSASPTPQENHSSLTVIVRSPASQPGSLGFTAQDVLVFGGLILLLAGVAIAVLSRHRRPPPNGLPPPARPPT